MNIFHSVNLKPQQTNGLLAWLGSSIHICWHVCCICLPIDLQALILFSMWISGCSSWRGLPSLALEDQWPWHCTRPQHQTTWGWKFPLHKTKVRICEKIGRWKRQNTLMPHQASGQTNHGIKRGKREFYKKMPSPKQILVLTSLWRESNQTQLSIKIESIGVSSFCHVH